MSVPVPTLVKLLAPLTTPLNVNMSLPFVTPMLVALAKATVPLRVLVPVATKAPLLPTPTPFKVKLFVMVPLKAPTILAVAPEATLTAPVPKAAALVVAAKMPVLIVVPAL